MQKLLKQRSEIEQSEIFQKWMIFNNLTKEQKFRIHQDWKAYYDQCWQSPSARLMMAMRDAITKNDMDRVRSLRQELTLIKGKTTVKPPKTSVDPETFYHNADLSHYKRLESSIEALKELLDGDVGEKEF